MIEPGETIELVRGRDVTLDLQFEDGSGDAYDMTGSCDHQLIVKRSKKDDDSQALLNKTGSAWTITDGSGGLVTLRIAAGDTRDVDVFQDGRVNPCEVWFVDAQGNQIGALFGFKVTDNVRKS